MYGDVKRWDSVLQGLHKRPLGGRGTCHGLCVVPGVFTDNYSLFWVGSDEKNDENYFEYSLETHCRRKKRSRTRDIDGDTEVGCQSTL